MSDHGWCYDYQKGSLTRQQLNWAESNVQFAICLNIQANRSTPGSYSDAETFASLTAALSAP